MKKSINKILLVFAVLGFTACELDLQESPNVLNPSQGDDDFLLNGIQTQFGVFFQRMQDDGAEITRMENLFGTTYEAAFAATDFDNQWQDAYADILIEVKNLEASARPKGLFHHIGIAKVIEAYTLITLVDFFADVPWSEALDANNLAPLADPGADVYAAALVSLDSALANLAKEPLSTPATDLFFDADPESWYRAAKSLELKINLQKRLVDAAASTSAIEALIAEDSMINTAAGALVYQYGTQLAAPNSQHPYYNGNYSGGASEYMANFYMNLLINDKATPDPRLEYYFYRQDVDPTTDVTERDCIGAVAPPWYGPEDVYCLQDNGYWGRDHLDNAGIPPDTQKRTVYGSYPAGGQYDAGQDVLAAQGDGLGGAGIWPIIMPFSVQFWLAEAALELGTSGDPRAYLAAGVRSSLEYVRDWDPNGTMTDGEIDTYVAAVEANYDAAGSDAERLAVIIKEYYIASWGNGVDMYNAYRRTGYPENMQPALRIENPGVFYRSFIYPASYVNRNVNATQKTTNGVKVFWDNNPDGFID